MSQSKEINQYMAQLGFEAKNASRELSQSSGSKKNQALQNIAIEIDTKRNEILEENGILIIHIHKKDNIDISGELKILDTRIYGISKIIIGS